MSHNADLLDKIQTAPDEEMAKKNWLRALEALSQARHDQAAAFRTVAFNHLQLLDLEDLKDEFDGDYQKADFLDPEDDPSFKVLHQAALKAFNEEQFGQMLEGIAQKKEAYQEELEELDTFIDEDLDLEHQEEANQKLKDLKKAQRDLDALISKAKTFADTHFKDAILAKAHHDIEALERELASEKPRLAKGETVIQDTLQELEDARTVASHVLNTSHTFGFTDTLHHQEANIYEGLGSLGDSSAPLAELQQAESQTTTFKGVALNEKVVIRSAKLFDRAEQQVGVLKQTHDGKVSNLSTDNLTDAQMAQVALKQVQMLLSHYSPDKGNVILRGYDKEMGKKVYAALLLVAQEGNIDGFDASKIDVRIDGVTPGKLDKNSWFIDRHLLNHVNKKDVLEQVSVAKNAATTFHARLQAYKDAPELEKPDKIVESKQEFEVKPG